MTPALKAELEALEAEFAELDKAEKTHREIHEELSAEIAPTLEKIHANAAELDVIKPRHRDLAEKIVHLRKAVG